MVCHFQTGGCALGATATRHTAYREAGVTGTLSSPSIGPASIDNVRVWVFHHRILHLLVEVVGIRHGVTASRDELSASERLSV